MNSPDIDTSPSSPARLLYGQMVARSDDLVLALDSTLALCVDRGRAGQTIHAELEMAELIAAGWISEHQDGGWNLSQAMQTRQRQ